MKAFNLFSFILLGFISINLRGQTQASNSFINKVEAYQKIFATEKLYLSFDKPYYNVGDTLWFKSFLLNGDLNATKRTDKIYVELFNDSLILIEKRVIALNNGLGYGDFALNNKLADGTYIIRAYSNWQQNFGNDYFFQKSFYIGNVGDKTWLLDSYQKLNTSNAKRTLDLKIRITNTKNEAAGLKDVEVYLMNNKKRLMKADLQTSVSGVIETQIPLGENKIMGNYNFLIINKKDKSIQSALPIILQDVDQVDLQFMPEGGFMVNDIFGRVAFKSIGADGLGKNISGKITNDKNEAVADFTTTHKGMGSFYLLPKKGETYFAQFNLNGKEQKVQLPPVKSQGTTLRIDRFSKPDSIYIYIKASEEKRLENYQLLAMAGNETIISATINLKLGFGLLKLAKIDFPDGIIHFTLISPDQLPLNERQVFINRKQKINLQVKSNKSSYSLRDSVSLELVATKEDGSPVSGSFSVSVTDNGQIKDTNSENIASYFLLQSDIKGNIEDAAWYFSNEEPSTLLALDNLLLAQGWIGYQWDDITKASLKPKFKAEKGNSIEGSLTNLLKNPVPNINVTLMSLGKNIFVTDTTSNADGIFKFIDLPYLDSATYTIKIKNAKGKTALANIVVQEFEPAKDITYVHRIKPWYVNADSTTLRYYKNAEKLIAPAKNERLKLEGNMLREVEIKGQLKLNAFKQKTAWDSKFIKEITEEELKKIPRKTLLDLLNEKIPALTVGNYYADGPFGIQPYEIDGVKYPPPSRPRRHEFYNYMIGGFLLSHVMIDGINTHFVAIGTDDQIGNVPYQSNQFQVSRTALHPEVFFTNKHIFNTLSAEDIKHINVYRGASNYYLDITTRSGKGPWIVTTQGIYVHRPLPIYRAKDFYSPKYTANKNISTPDYRSTIFWDANVVTGENGKATISFYAADKPSTYTIKIEGTDLLGRFGYQKSNIKIANQSDSK
ncbi:hypothetical protein [Pedobacter frigiditerrae]|uniref:hypothetical protein n=1 Tax=Pedobacter frigiditerrae TaxID=2530452 RepID=UPI00292DACE2|nr:hypothetical protein [Pedobacter frigiditerrae]